MAAPSLNLAEKVEVLAAELTQKEHENLLLKEQLNQQAKEIKALENVYPPAVRDEVWEELEKIDEKNRYRIRTYKNI